MEHVIYSGAKDTMEKIAVRGYALALNPKTMKYQKIPAEFRVQPAPWSNGISWQIVSNTDVKQIAAEKELIF